MAASDRTFEDLLTRIERREQTARRRAIVYSFVPIAMASILLAYTAYRIQGATRQVEGLKAQAAHYQEQVVQLEAEASGLKKQSAQYQEQVSHLEARITDLQGNLVEAEARLGAATALGQYIHPIDLVDVKMLASRYPREASLLQRILDLRERGIKWRLGGQSPTEGFDSPSFAAFILRQLNLPGGDIRPGESLLAASRRLWEVLPEASQPRVGDLAFYPAGYVLFYFLDQRQKPFVIGMTPFGITALNPNFAKVVGYRRLSP